MRISRFIRGALCSQRLQTSCKKLYNASFRGGPNCIKC